MLGRDCLFRDEFKVKERGTKILVDNGRVFTVF
jgi:hypothetical protein